MSTPETDSASKGSGAAPDASRDAPDASRDAPDASRDAPDASPDAPDASREASNAGRDEGRSSRKRRAILEAATEVFLRKGYLGTSMDEIAARAAVSKQTVYKHFADKESLFAEIVTSAVNEVSDPNYEEVVNLEFSGDVESDLRGLASRQLARVMQPRLLQLRRLVIGEAGRFPELGRVYYERGPGRTIDALAGAFERLAERDLLQLDDPHLAAAHFNWLVMSIPLNEAMLCGDDDLPGAADLDRYSETGVRAFLAAYGPG